MITKEMIINTPGFLDEIIAGLQVIANNSSNRDEPWIARDLLRDYSMVASPEAPPWFKMAAQKFIMPPIDFMTKKLMSNRFIDKEYLYNDDMALFDIETQKFVGYYRVCEACKHEEIIKPHLILDEDKALFGSNLDFCTKCETEWW